MEKQFELHKERDFSGVFSDGVGFLKVHFKGILKSFVFIVAPIITVATILVSIFSVQVVNAMTQSQDPRIYTTGGVTTPFSMFSGSLLLVVLLYMIAALLAVTTIYSYIKVYNEKGDTQITPSDVWKHAGSGALKLFLYFLGYFLVFIIPFWILMFLFGLLMMALSAIPVLGAIVSFLVMLLLFLGLGTYFSVLVPVIIYEDKGFFGSLGRTSTLLKGNMWQTMGVVVVSVLLVQLVFYGFYFLFLLVLQALGVYSATPDMGVIQIFVIIYAILAPILLFFAYTFQYSISSFLYYSLLEKTDHVGLKMRVDNISEEDTDKPAEEY